MISFLLSACLLAAPTSALAAEPMPHSERNEKIENIRSSGAIRVESAPLENPDELEGRAGESPANPPLMRPPAPEAAKSAEATAIGAHLFGLHASLGVPHPINVGLDYVHPSKRFSAALSTGQFSLKASEVDVKIQNTEIALRWHPFAGSFFVGSLFGTQKITGDKTETVSGVSVHGSLDLDANYVTPELGWLWGARESGFFAMVELGVHSPSNVKSTFTDDAPGIVQGTSDYANFVSDIKDQSEKYGKMTLPQVAVRIGWLF